VRELTAEFIGTMLLVLLTDGTVATARLARSHGVGGNWLTIAVGSAIAVSIAVGLAGPISGGHVNPAVTFALAAWGLFPAERVAAYVGAQLAGGFSGAVLVWLLFWRHWEATSDPAVKRGVFCTGPAIRYWPANLATECVGTAVLALGVGAAVTGRVPSAVVPWWLGGLVLAIGLALGGTTGFALNPARDAAPRLAYTLLPIAGRGDSDWRYGWIPIVGPVLGALLGIGVWRLL
jgi:glycerol uptake facilitator protein